MKAFGVEGGVGKAGNEAKKGSDLRFQASDGRCEPCDVSCLTCTTRKTCSACAAGRLLKEGRCLCPSGTYGANCESCACPCKEAICQLLRVLESSFLCSSDIRQWVAANSLRSMILDPILPVQRQCQQLQRMFGAGKPDSNSFRPGSEGI